VKEDTINKLVAWFIVIGVILIFLLLAYNLNEERLSAAEYCISKGFLGGEFQQAPLTLEPQIVCSKPIRKCTEDKKFCAESMEYTIFPLNVSEGK
jgi:hypothetical protein